MINAAHLTDILTEISRSRHGDQPHTNTWEVIKLCFLTDYDDMDSLLLYISLKFK